MVGGESFQTQASPGVANSKGACFRTSQEWLPVGYASWCQRPCPTFTHSDAGTGRVIGAWSLVY